MHKTSSAEDQGLMPMTLGSSPLEMLSHLPALPLFIESLETPSALCHREPGSRTDLQILIFDAQPCHILFPSTAQVEKTPESSVY